MSTENTSRTVVRALVGAGLLDPMRSEEAGPVVADVLARGTRAAGTMPLRRRMAEVAGYVGGAFVVGAAVLFVSTTWSDLSLGGKVGLLVVTALVLAAAGGVLTVSSGGPAALRRSEEDVRARLTSVLLTGAATAAAFAAGLWLDDVVAPSELAVFLAAGVGLVAVLAGYLVAPTVLGQLGAAVAAFTMVPPGLYALTDDVSPAVFGPIVLALGLVWLLAAEQGWWAEREAGRVIGCLLALVGAQIPVFGSVSWLGYLLTALVAAVAFGGYLRTRSIAFLATGVVGLTLAVPEALSDWTDGSLGAAGILLVTGVTLLGTSLLGLRLRQEVHGPHRTA